MSKDEVIIINGEPFFRISNGTSCDYAPIPTEFKPYFEKLQQENQQLIAEVKELELIIGLRQKSNLIHKFDKEYDEEDKRKNPNRDYASIMPDAEEVYKRYYEQQERIKGLQEERDYLFDKLSIENQQLKEEIKGGD